MLGTAAADRPTTAAQSARNAGRSTRLGAFDILVLSAWLGLTAGLVEVGTTVLCRAINPTDRLYLVSRHFLWVTPLANLTLCLGAGIGLAALTNVWPRMGSWLSPRLLCALAILPVLLVLNLHIFPEAWMVVALGLGFRVAPWLGRRPVKTPRYLVWSFPALVGSVLILAGFVFVGDWLKARREDGRALPSAGSPNVLLIVLDTVRADRLSLYGYHRPTSTALQRLAKRGIRFDSARATAPWTLASHASFFTGRWPHELGVQWETPLRSNFPMLAEYLGAHGYATAGIVANTRYCSYDTRLDRGFTHYEDYEFEKLSFLRTSAVFERVRKTAFLFLPVIFHDPGLQHSVKEFLETWSGYGYRRDARSINRGFLDWLDRRDRRRPFFAFLNYFDAHHPYKLPPEGTPNFTRRPESPDELLMVYDMWAAMDKSQLPPYYLTLARDSYDNCVAYLDEMVGQLIGELARRGLREKTWVVIAGDHGEGLGEHGLYDHGESLYNTEIRVPLLILPPSDDQAGRVVSDTVSLRDLPATVVDVVGLAAGAPFPGRSLADLWGSAAPRARTESGHEVLSELASGNQGDPNHGRSPVHRGPLVSLAEGDLVYIYNEGDQTEELYNEREDPRELTSLASKGPMLPNLQRFRRRLANLKAP